MYKGIRLSIKKTTPMSAVLQTYMMDIYNLMMHTCDLSTVHTLLHCFAENLHSPLSL